MQWMIGYFVVAVVLLIVVNRIAFRGTTHKVEKNTERNAERNIKQDIVIEAPETHVTHVTTASENEITLSRVKSRAAGSEPEKMGNTTKAKPEVPVDLRPGLIVAVLILGAFVAILNQTLINVALPHIMNDLNISASTAQWLVTGYMLVNGVLIPLTAFLMETFTVRQLFISAMTIFSIGSIIAGVSPNFGLLLTGRLVQAVGAGIIMPLMMNVFMTIFPPEKRGAAMGMMGLAIIFAPAIGPTLSGWIVENYSWRILFFIVLPIAIADIFLAFSWLRNVLELRHPKLDVLSIVLSSVGFGGLLYGFSEAGNNGWGSAEVVLSLLLGTIGLVSFVWRQYVIPNPLLEFRVFKYEVFTLTVMISSIVNVVMFAGMLLLPIYLQSIRGFTPIESGLLLLPGAIAMGIMSPIAGAIFDKIGARALAIVGLIITTTTNYEFSFLTNETTYNHILLLYTLRMFGMSFLMMPLITAGMNQLPAHMLGHGTAMNNTMRQVAGSLGTAILVTIMTNRTNYHILDASNVMTSTNPYLVQQMAGLSHGLSSLTGIPGSGNTLSTQLVYGIIAKQSVINGINDAFLVATWIAVVALLMSFFIKHIKPVRKNDSKAPATTSLSTVEPEPNR